MVSRLGETLDESLYTGVERQLLYTRSIVAFCLSWGLNTSTVAGMMMINMERLEVGSFFWDDFERVPL